MIEHAGGAVATISGSRGEAEAEQVRNDQTELAADQWSQASELQKAAVESVQQQQGWSVTNNGDRHGAAKTLVVKIPPLHRLGQAAGLRVQKIWNQAIQTMLQG